MRHLREYTVSIVSLFALFAGSGRLSEETDPAVFIQGLARANAPIAMPRASMLPSPAVSRKLVVENGPTVVVKRYRLPTMSGPCGVNALG